ncbi:alpha/beta hydrolase [Pseudodonghicola flavimaris]|uniref:Alpha/beta hydrolase n=1 Tax=Pseudodonghicola flavimaris TaxID=3050036 RepID=A0ABT7F5C6_9RHOB|nr:alpha/beta hydrolase [Pseudodonghicola flavimaris]MDK3019808.1 alpha/beta hydrolase [Pseudodonghicola flavimaris]
MTDKRDDLSLGDQKFLFDPDSWEPAEEAGTAEPIDLEIIATTYRSIVDQDAFEEMVASWRTKIDTLGPDKTLGRGISRQLFGQLTQARRTMETLDIPVENDPLKKAVTDVAGPAIVLSPNGRAAATNIAGERAFGVQEGAFLDPSVIAPSSAADYAALRRAAGGQGNAGHAILTIAPETGAEDTGGSFLAEAYLIQTHGQSEHYVAIRTLEVDWTERVADRLRQAFGLSAAEAEVARLFFQLRNLDQVAERRGVSRLTVRTQIKSIMAKAGAPTNVDLMRMLSMVANREVMEQRGEAPVWHDPLDRERRIRLDDGRVVAWTWMGAESGTPAVMLRGFPMTYILPAEAEERLRRAGVKLYALSRPGYGNSSLHQDLSARADNLAALRAFLDHEITGPCVGIGMSNGLVPLLEEQHANPDRFRALIAIGYTGVLDRSGIHRLQPIQQTMTRLAARAPWLVELMAKSGHRMMRHYGVDWYLERAYRTRPIDIRTCRDPNMVALIRNACAHLLKQGHGAFVRDLQLAVAEIDEVIEALTIPMLFLAPTEDGVFDVRRYRDLETRNPLIRVEPVPEAGELIFYQQSRLIVDRIIQAVQQNRIAPAD